MEQFDTRFDGAVNAGRKGIAYDWQSLLAAEALDRELTELTAPHSARLFAR